MLLNTWITCEGLFGSSRSRSSPGRDRDRDRDRDIVRMINAKMIDYEYDMQSGRINLPRTEILTVPSQTCEGRLRIEECEIEMEGEWTTKDNDDE
jgi:hypothetical protein